MDRQTEQWLRDTLGPAHKFFAGNEDRENAADHRADAIVKAVNAGFKRMAEAHERGLREVADALRQLARR